jgi:hypothetical protein
MSEAERPKGWALVDDGANRRWYWMDATGRATAGCDAVAVFGFNDPEGKWRLIAHGGPPHVRRARETHLARYVTEKVRKTGLGPEAFADAFDCCVYLESVSWPTKTLNALVTGLMADDSNAIFGALKSLDFGLEANDPDLKRLEKALIRKELNDR